MYVSLHSFFALRINRPECKNEIFAILHVCQPSLIFALQMMIVTSHCKAIMMNEPSQMISRSPEDTYNLGRKIGESLKPGTVIALTGELGSGKTAFVQGLARGLGVPTEYYITSPTYTLVNEYPGRCPLFHADLYRLERTADIEEIGLYDIIRKGEGVAAVEWAERLDKETLSAAIRIRFEILDEESRRVVIEK